MLFTLSSDSLSCNLPWAVIPLVVLHLRVIIYLEQGLFELQSTLSSDSLSCIAIERYYLPWAVIPWVALQLRDIIYLEQWFFELQSTLSSDSLSCIATERHYLPWAVILWVVVLFSPVLLSFELSSPSSTEIRLFELPGHFQLPPFLSVSPTTEWLKKEGSEYI